MADVGQALSAYKALDPEGWGTGLSPEGARLGLDRVLTPLLGNLPRWPDSLRPPRRLVIWCAGNVFTAPLEWTAIFAAAGTEIVLKAPSTVPGPVLDLARCFAAEGLPVEASDLPHEQAWHLLDGADAVLGFGSDAAMSSLDSTLQPGVRRALFGHRVSIAIVNGPQHAERLVDDTVLFDGRGCMSPVAVFALSQATEVAHALAQGLAGAALKVPRGELEPAWGPRWRRRVGLARILGQVHEGHEWAVPVLPPRWFEPEPLPRLLPVHPVGELDTIPEILNGLPLGTCGTNLDSHDWPRLVEGIGFPLVARLGEMHTSPLNGTHENIDIRTRLGEEP